MPTVTELKSTRGGRIAVHLDGEYACTVSQALVARLRLYQDRDLTDAEARDLRHEAARDYALQAAYRLLNHRQRSVKELSDRLAARGIGSEVVAATVMALQADGLLNDAAFAAAFVSDKRRLQGWGSRRIEHELRRLGVPPALVAEALAQTDAAETGEEAEAARADAALARLGTPRPPLDVARRRALAQLQRRGFAPGVAYGAVQRWAGTADAAESRSELISEE